MASDFTYLFIQLPLRSISRICGNDFTRSRINCQLFDWAKNRCVCCTHMKEEKNRKLYLALPFLSQILIWAGQLFASQILLRPWARCIIMLLAIRRRKDGQVKSRRFQSTDYYFSFSPRNTDWVCVKAIRDSRTRGKSSNNECNTEEWKKL